MRVSIAAMAIAVFGALSASAQEPVTAPQDIIVHAQRNAEQVRTFVHSVSAVMPVGQLARWNEDICPGVIGANWRQARTIIDQIAIRAMAVGLHVGRTGCNANLTILVTGDADNIAQAIYREHRLSLLNPNGVEGATLGEAALHNFVDTSRPVRWWYTARKTTDDGHALTDRRAEPINDRASVAIAGSSDSSQALENIRNGTASNVGEGASVVQGVRSNGTRLSRATRHDFNTVLVIVDTNRLNGAPIVAVADYIAFVSLAQVNPDAGNLPFPSILNLFSTQDAAQRPDHMTDWDVDYLDGLYHATRAARNIGQQESEITQRMTTPHS
jgi:hypothetical protein